MSPGWDLLVTAHIGETAVFALDSVDFNPYPACWLDSFFWRWDNSIQSPLPSVLCQLAEILTDTHAALLMAHRKL
jgi:hypothetical protein